MSEGYTRCQFIDEKGKECEEWFPVNGKTFCKIHADSKYVDISNEERDYCYKFFTDITKPTTEELNRLEAHIAGIETEIEKLKVRFLSSRAVKRETVNHLSEEQRKERLKYKPAKVEKTDKKSDKKEKKDKNPLAGFKSKGMSDKQIQDLMNLDFDDALAIFEAAKKKKESNNDSEIREEGTDPSNS